VIPAGSNSTNVTLDGTSSSDPDGDSLTYAWTQTSGASVTINNADKATANVDLAKGSYGFQLVVTDSNGAASSAAAVSVSVGQEVFHVTVGGNAFNATELDFTPKYYDNKDNDNAGDDTVLDSDQGITATLTVQKVDDENKPIAGTETTITNNKVTAANYSQGDVLLITQTFKYGDINKTRSIYASVDIGPKFDAIYDMAQTDITSEGIPSLKIN
jgi:hypothetical protein